ncbi:hypothetical protein [Streptomyces sp. FIT100]|uniref:hypothetical protein n=1 Tax=Streptomyces sp. FIT100 TaxID=2837956 RepID=UPI0021C7B0BE|nr:hypothetical protein [Streptomyces sp. FIT100]UUN25511.1 hypothetical protein KK483_03055 [Streptomyces sp. FIT100]
MQGLEGLVHQRGQVFGTVAVHCRSGFRLPAARLCRLISPNPTSSVATFKGKAMVAAIAVIPVAQRMTATTTRSTSSAQQLGWGDTPGHHARIGTKRAMWCNFSYLISL